VAPFAAEVAEAALPSLVRIEPGGEAGDEKASGFVVRLAGGDEPGSMGRGDIPGSVLVVTNRHVPKG
jgi:S1-C subfamily serine protease